MDDDSIVQTRTLNVENCEEKCNGLGKCGYCGPKGYCCDPNDTTGCPGSFSASIQAQGIQKPRCVLGVMTRDSLARELSPELPCVSISNTECKTMDDFSDMPSGSMMTLSKTFQECQRFFSTFECQTQERMSPSDIPKCITRITNECGIKKHEIFEKFEEFRAVSEKIPMPKVVHFDLKIGSVRKNF